MKIEAKEYYYSHDCGCCTDWGVTLVIDGKVVDQTFTNTADAYEHVLEAILGHEVVYTYDNGEEEEEE